MNYVVRTVDAAAVDQRGKCERPLRSVDNDLAIAQVNTLQAMVDRRVRANDLHDGVAGDCRRASR